MSGPDGEKSVGESPASFGDKLPAGIKDLSRWGKTLLNSTGLI